MSDAAADELLVVVECRDCAEHLTFQDHSADNVRGQVAEFFAEHPHCRTAIDLSNAASLCFPDLRSAAQ
ncbi:MAG: hypothetical protein JJD92_06195 [Frankiaceae bacterium]|nr:hypothetical protein [Frankiaceae bacterium]